MLHLTPKVLIVMAFLVCADRWMLVASGAESGEWSREATSIRSYIDRVRKLTVTSPDRRKIVIVEDVHLSVMSDGEPLLGMEHEGVGTIAELTWGSDSSAFFLTESDGGIVGRWDTWVYLVQNNQVRRTHITEEVATRFKRYYECDEPEEPNVGGIAWLQGTKQLLVVAEVPPHSSCRDMGLVRGYIVSVPDGKVVGEMDDKSLKSDWGKFLGSRFR